MSTVAEMTVPVHILYATISLLVTESRSLKDKRRIIKSIRQRLVAQYNIALSEIGYHDEWQRCVLGLTMLGNDRRQLDRVMDSIENRLLDTRGLTVLEVQRQWL